MHFVQHLSHSFDQMQTMAVRCGLDLPAAVVSGRLTGDRLRTGAFRCSSCKMSSTCKLALATNAQLEAVPAYCINGALFTLLPKLDDRTG